MFGPKSEQIHVYRSVVEPLLEEVNVILNYFYLFGAYLVTRVCAAFGRWTLVNVGPE